MSLDRDLELIYEIGSLRFVQRSWRQFHNPQFQNFPEHTFRVIWLSLILAEREKQGDRDKIIRMALLHDIPESRTGDADYLTRLYTQQFENEAITDTFKDTSLNYFLNTWNEYKKMESIEAKLVKDADTLDVDFEIREQAIMGNRVGESWAEMRAERAKKLYTQSAKEIWEKIGTSNPHSWHLNAKNRYTAGDWKPEDK